MVGDRDRTVRLVTSAQKYRRLVHTCSNWVILFLSWIEPILLEVPNDLPPKTISS